jgi:2-amino-4-hydroxy-6-hydroxymethyldihydropteridine diphosphokinase
VAEAFLALGGNLGSVRDTFRRAVALLCDDGRVRLMARSSDYATPPWGVEDQPEFVNQCIRVETVLTPPELLARAQSIERTFGRTRKSEQRYGPRTLDIDILAYDDFVLSTPGLILPHPRLFERAFVLVPLAEIAPGAVIGGRKIDDALSGLDLRGIEKLAPLEA